MLYSKQKVKRLVKRSRFVFTHRKNIRGGVSGVFSSRYFGKIDRLVIIYKYATNLNGWAMLQASAHGRYENVIVSFDEFFATGTDGETCTFVDVDLGNLGSVKIKTQFFRLCPETKNVDKEFLCDFMKTLLAQRCNFEKVLICD